MVKGLGRCRLENGRRYCCTAYFTLEKRASKLDQTVDELSIEREGTLGVSVDTVSNEPLEQLHLGFIVRVDCMTYYQLFVDGFQNEIAGLTHGLLDMGQLVVFNPAFECQESFVVDLGGNKLFDLVCSLVFSELEKLLIRTTVFALNVTGTVDPINLSAYGSNGRRSLTFLLYTLEVKITRYEAGEHLQEMVTGEITGEVVSDAVVGFVTVGINVKTHPVLDGRGDGKLQAPYLGFVELSTFAFLGKLDEIINEAAGSPSLTDIGFVLDLLELHRFVIEAGEDGGLLRTPRNGVPFLTVPKVGTMYRNSALVDLGIMTVQVSGHKLSGEIARIKDLEIKSEVDSSNTLEGVGMSLQEILQELSGIVEVTSAVVKSKMAGALFQNLVFVDIVCAMRLPSDFNEGLTI